MHPIAVLQKINSRDYVKMVFIEWSAKMKSSLTLNLDSNSIYRKLKEKLELEDDSVNADVIKIINDVGNDAISKLKTVIKNMQEYTLHDDVHIYNVLRIMDMLIPQKTLDKLSIPELMLLILTAFFHDIGMAPEEEYLQTWKGENNLLESEFLKTEYNRYQKFRGSHRRKIEEIQRLHEENNHAVAQVLEEYIITEYIRLTHAERARAIIADKWKDKIQYKDTNLTAIFAELCLSHNEDAMRLLDIDSFELCDHNTYVCVPFIAVVLRLADIIDFDPKRTPSVLFSHLAVRHPVSISEWKKHQSINAWSISNDKLIYAAQCEHPAIEATIRGFCDLIDTELKNCNLILSSINNPYNNDDTSHYKINLPKQVDRSKIRAVKDILTGEPIYQYQDTKFELAKNQIIDLLMGTELYGRPEVALRELIQNSIDACLVREKLSKAWGENYVPHIKVSFYSKNSIDYLEIYDNGIGMDQHIINNYYSNVGSSFYKSREFYELMSDVDINFKPISRFGIGILSCFMVSDSLEVDTKKVISKYKYANPIKLMIEGYDSIFYTTKGERTEPGTTTVLQLRKVHPWKKMSEEDFIRAVKKIVQLPPFEMEIEFDNKTKKYDSESFLDLDPNSLKDYHWKTDNNIKEIKIDLSSEEYGFNGKAIVGIIVSKKKPVERIEVATKEVEIDGQRFDISMEMFYENGKISKSSQSISLDDEGEIETGSSYSTLLSSKSSFSIHGIEFPNSLFPEYYYTDPSKTKLLWPFPILLVLDLGGNGDLNLNSARTEIIYDSKWIEFEENLFYIICKQIKHKIGNRWWPYYKDILVKKIKREELLAKVKQL